MPIEFPATIDNKPIIQLENGDQIVDLTQQSMNITVDQPMINYVLVTEDLAMRIDSITKISMGSTAQTEKMLKFNDISNPFTIDTGDLLFVPDPIYANINMKFGTAAEKQKFDIRNQYIDPEKISKLDPTLGKFDNRNKPKKADPSKTTPPLPPNFANFGDKEIEIKGGKIYFGSAVSKNSNEVNAPLSKTEFLSKLLKNNQKSNS